MNLLELTKVIGIREEDYGQSSSKDFFELFLQVAT